MNTTISDLVEQTVTRLEANDLHFGHGCDNPRDEAIWAIMHSANLMHQEYEEVYDCVLPEEQVVKACDLIERRIETRKPLAYLIGEAWFAGLEFNIDERAIVPRSHFGDLIQDGFGPWVRLQQMQRVLDLCTGNGCIAIALALRYPHLSIDASDIDGRALELAKTNVNRYNCGNRVHLIQGDLFNNLDGQQYDLILCNPPYVEEPALNEFPSEFQHEPHHAFAAGEDGLKFVKVILREATKHLTENSYLLMELGSATSALEASYPQVPFFWLTTRSGESVVLTISKQELMSHRKLFHNN